VAKRAQVVAAASPGFRDWVRDSGRIPITPRMTRSARHLMVGCAAVASLLLLVIGTLAIGWPAGLLASQLLLLHPIVVAAYNQATADAVALMFSMAAALAALCWFRRFSQPTPPRLREGLMLTLLTGLLLALACGAKMNSLVVLGLAGLLVAGAGIQAWLRADGWAPGGSWGTDWPSWPSAWACLW